MGTRVPTEAGEVRTTTCSEEEDGFPGTWIEVNIYALRLGKC